MRRSSQPAAKSREGRFRRLNVGQVQEALAAATASPAPEPVAQRLMALWPTLQPALMRVVGCTRGDERSASLTNLLADRAQKEAADIRSVLDELARTIVAELTESEPVQLSLWSPAEALINWCETKPALRLAAVWSRFPLRLNRRWR